MSGMHVLIVVNPKAGKGNFQYKIEALSLHLQKSEVRFLEYFTQPTKGTSHLSNFLKENSTITDIVIIGGDGTINMCINALPHFNFTISIVNNGTGNDSVKNIYPKKSLSEQIKSVTEGKIRTIDLGKCNGRYFLNGVGIGFDGLIVKKMESQKGKKKGLWAYLSIVLLLLPRKTYFPVSIQHDDKEIKCNLFSLTVTKGSTFGGGFIINPNADPEDGELDTCRFNHLTFIDKILILPWVFVGKHGWSKKISFSKSKNVEVVSKHSIPGHIDGEVISASKYTIEVVPKKLNIRI